MTLHTFAFTRTRAKDYDWVSKPAFLDSTVTNWLVKIVENYADRGRADNPPTMLIKVSDHILAAKVFETQEKDIQDRPIYSLVGVSYEAPLHSNYSGNVSDLLGAVNPADWDRAQANIGETIRSKMAISQQYPSSKSTPRKSIANEPNSKTLTRAPSFEDGGHNTLLEWLQSQENDLPLFYYGPAANKPDTVEVSGLALTNASSKMARGRVNDAKLVDDEVESSAAIVRNPLLSFKDTRGASAQGAIRDMQSNSLLKQNLRSLSSAFGVPSDELDYEISIFISLSGLSKNKVKLRLSGGASESVTIDLSMEESQKLLDLANASLTERKIDNLNALTQRNNWGK